MTGFNCGTEGVTSVAGTDDGEGAGEAPDSKGSASYITSEGPETASLSEE